MDRTEQQALGRRLRAAREAAHMTQREGVGEVMDEQHNLISAFKELDALSEQGVWLHELSNRWENAWRCILERKMLPGPNKWYQDWGAETAAWAIQRAIAQYREDIAKNQ